MSATLTKSLRRLRGLILKEYLQIIRDPSSILIALGLPCLLMFLFGYGISLDVDRVHLGMALEKPSEASLDLLRDFEGSRYFEVTPALDRRTLEPPLMAGQVRGLLVLPMDFARQRASGKQSPIQVITDGSEPNTANFLQNYVQGAWATWLVHRGPTQPSRMVKKSQLGQAQMIPKVWFNQQLISRNTLLPGAIPIVVTLVGTLLTTLVVAREWDRGTMEALISTPVTIEEILISKFIPYFVLGMGTLYFCVWMTQSWYQVPFRGSFFTLTLASALYVLNALGLGLLISSTTKNQFAAAQATLFLAFLPAFLLSGYLYEISSMPQWVQHLTVIFPVRYFVTSLRTIFLAGDVWTLLWPCFIKMLLIAGLLYLMIAYKTVKRLD